MKQSIENHILGIVCSVFEAYSAVLFLPEEEGDLYYLAASFSLGSNIPEDVVVVPGKGLVGWIVQARRPMLAAPFDQPESALGYYAPGQEEGIKTFMGVPIPTGGALCVDSKKQYSFSEKDFKILGLFAELFARQQTLRQSELVGDIPRYFAELGVIQNLRFRYKKWPEFLQNYLRTVSDATDFDYCALATSPENADYYCIESESAPLLLEPGRQLRLAKGSGIVGWVFKSEQVVAVEEGDGSQPSSLFGKLPDMPEFPSFMCLPIMAREVCFGVLCLASATPRHMDESLRSFARQAADYLSLFLETLYLKNRLRSLLPKVKPVGGFKAARPPSPPRGDEEPA